MLLIKEVRDLVESKLCWKVLTTVEVLLSFRKNRRLSLYKTFLSLGSQDGYSRGITHFL